MPKSMKAGELAVSQKVAEGIHKWLMRRWNSFNLAVHSMMALVLAHVFAPVFSIRQVCGWWLTTAFAVVVLFFAASNARRETMEMIEFQSHRRQKVSRRKVQENEPQG